MFYLIFVILAVHALLAPPQTPPPVLQTTVRFVDRTEVALSLEVDGVEQCTAASFGECEAVVAYGPHTLAATYNQHVLITRESQAKEKVLFAVCHTFDENKDCPAGIQKEKYEH